MKVEKGNKVKVDYTGSFEDGQVFDSSAKHGAPLEFVVGGKQVVPGFDAAIEGMAPGEEKEILLKPEDAYGLHRPDLIKKVPRDQLPQDQQPEVGMMLAVKTPEGGQFPAKITGVTEGEVTIDLNHPLSGKTLKFKIKLVEILPK
jgi:FKBP-type peptidyl-prolyl cis-trans isomerase 2